MANTLTQIGRKESHGSEYVTRWQLDAASYVATSDIVLSASDLGLKRVRDVVLAPQEDATKFAVWDGDKDSITLTLHSAVDGTELADGDHGVFRVTAYGV